MNITIDLFSVSVGLVLSVIMYTLMEQIVRRIRRKSKITLPDDVLQREPSINPNDIVHLGFHSYHEWVIKLIQREIDGRFFWNVYSNDMRFLNASVETFGSTRIALEDAQIFINTQIKNANTEGSEEVPQQAGTDSVDPEG